MCLADSYILANVLCVLIFSLKAQRTFGYMTTCYKAANSKDGLIYILRRIHCKWTDY